MSVRLEPDARIRDYVRSIIARAATVSDRSDSAEYAARRWGTGCGPTLLLRGLHSADRNEFIRDPDLRRKAGISATGLAGSEFEGTDAQTVEFFGAVLQAAIIGRIPTLHRVPFHVKVISVSDGTTAHWVGEGRAIPMSRMALIGSRLGTKKVAAVTVVTRELIEAHGSAAENRFEIDLRRAIAFRADWAFIDPSNAGSATTPPAVTYGAPTSASTGDIRTDLAELLEHFTGDLENAVLVMSPRTANSISLVTDTSGSLMFPDIGPRGGTLLQMPVLTSRAVPADTSGGPICMIDGAGIAFAQEGGEIGMSAEAAIEMSDAPTGAGDVPTAASTELVSMFQTESIAIRASVRTNWEVQRAGCVSVVTGAAYS